MGKAQMKRNEITEGIIWKQLLLFFFPIAIGTIVQQLYSVADTMIVGRFIGTKALASVGGSAAVVTNMIIYFFTGLATGAGVIVAQFYGAKDNKNLHKSVHTAYAFSIILGIVLAIIGWILTPWILKAMDTSPEILKDSIIYMRIIFVGMVATMIYNMGSAIMRAAGDSKRPLYYLIVCSVLNIVLDLIFIIVFKMGVAGAAIATITAQAFSGVLVSYSLMHAYDEVKLNLKEIWIDTKILISELRVGLPGGLQYCFSGLTNIVLQTAINGFGTETTAAWATFNKLDVIFWTILGAFGSSVTTFVGQNYGAKKYDRMWKSVRVCMGLALVICGIAQFCLYAFCEPMYRIFTSDPNVIELGVHFMRFLVPIYILFVFHEIPVGALRGMGFATMPTAFTLMGTVFLKIPWIIFVVPRYHSMETIMISYPLSWMFAMVLTIFYYFKKKKLIMMNAEKKTASLL